MPHRITFVMPHPVLGGGPKVVFQYAQLLHEHGHTVTILAEGPRPAWVHFEGTYLVYGRTPPALPPQTLVIATYWTTLTVAMNLQCGPVVHYCQGYEGDYAHLESVRLEIEATYRHPVPAFVVSPHLADLMEKQFGRPSYVLPPPLDLAFRPMFRIRPRRVPRILVQGIFECDWKGIRFGLEAVQRLRRLGQPCRLLRISSHPLSDEERAILEPDRYLCAIAPAKVANEVRRCDLLLFPSLPVEGFGLPLLEAMASRVPAVASRLPSTEFMTQHQVPLVSAKDPETMAQAAYMLLQHPKQWRQARRQGHAVAQRFHPKRMVQTLLDGIEWALQTETVIP